jgi:hypothetical protein
MDDRCGWMREGGDMQCVLESGHTEKLHVWGDVPAWAFIDGEDGTDNEEGIQEMPKMPSDCGCEIQSQATK